MKMQPIDSSLLDLLNKKFRSHSAVARELGITPRQYRKLRSSGNATERTLKQMKSLVGEIQETVYAVDQAVNG